jgi:hypothetical protein
MVNYYRCGCGSRYRTQEIHEETKKHRDWNDTRNKIVIDSHKYYDQMFHDALTRKDVELLNFLISVKKIRLGTHGLNSVADISKRIAIKYLKMHRCNVSATVHTMQRFRKNGIIWIFENIKMKSIYGSRSHGIWYDEIDYYNNVKEVLTEYICKLVIPVSIPIELFNEIKSFVY